MEDSIGFLLKKLSNRIKRYAHTLCGRRENEQPPCSVMHIWIIDFLLEHPDRDIFQKDIELEFSINRATASKMLTLMEQKELVRRAGVDYDARLKRIVPLPKAVAMFEEGKEVRRKIDYMLERGLTPEEKAVFIRLCKKVLDSMEG